MRTKYIITSTDPDSLRREDDDFEETELECCFPFLSLEEAERDFKSLTNGGTNMRFHLLRIQHIRSKTGVLK